MVGQLIALQDLMKGKCQVIANRAADTPVGQGDLVPTGPFNQRRIDVDRPEIVDDNKQIQTVLFRQQAIDKSGFSSAQIAAYDR